MAVSGPVIHHGHRLTAIVREPVLEALRDAKDAVDCPCLQAHSKAHSRHTRTVGADSTTESLGMKSPESWQG